VAEPQDTWEEPELGRIRSTPGAPPVGPTTYYARLVFLRRNRGVMFEEPSAVIPHARVCEGGGSAAPDRGWPCSLS